MTTSAPVCSRSRAAAARASVLGGRLTLRGQGRALLKFANTTFSRAARCSGKRWMTPGPADRRAHAVVTCHRSERGQQLAGLGVDRRRHAVDAPDASGPAQTPEHTVDPLGQVGLVVRLGEYPPRPAREGQPALEQVGRAAPGRGQLFPIPLDFLARFVVDLDRRPAPVAGTAIAVRPETAEADLPDEGDVALLIAEPADLVVEGRAPDVRVIAQTDLQVLDEWLEAVGVRRLPSPWLAQAAQVGLDRVAADADVAGDGRGGPAPPPEC